MNDVRIIAVAIMLVGIVSCNAAVEYATVAETTITVVDKERITTSSTDSDGNASISSKYLVFTESEVFENTDTIWHWKFNSSDFQGHLREGETYNVKVNRWRVPFLGWYRNIIEVGKPNEK